MSSCIYPGSFDPFHKGHLDVVKNISMIFDKVYIAPIKNKNKAGRLKIEDRILLIEMSIKNLEFRDKIEIITFDEMLVNYCKKNKISTIVKGIRNVNDYVLENEMATAIRMIDDDVKTLFYPSDPIFQAISSSMVFDVINNNGDLTPFLPIEIVDTVKRKSEAKYE